MTEREQRYFRQHGGHFFWSFSCTPEINRVQRTAFTKHPEDRTAAIKALVEKLGGRFEAFYYSFGEYDGIVVLEAPDEATVTAFALAAVAPGHIRATKTTVLMRAGAVVEATWVCGQARTHARLPGAGRPSPPAGHQEEQHGPGHQAPFP
jgi:uncharacterized protein with GYD domain